LVDESKVLVGKRQNRDLRQVDLLVPREGEQEVEGALEAAHVHHQRRTLGQALAIRKLEVAGFHR
jgi:hypothetical protein